jgi:ketosteroid isomerase-like protein
MRHFSCTALLAISLTACGQTDGSGQDTRTDDEAAIRAAYDAWVVAADGKDIESWVTFLGPDAIFLPPDAEALTTFEDIRDSYVRTFEDPNWSIACEHTEVEIADAGDIAWSRGYCNFTISGPDGEPAQNRTKWNKVWIKHTDGSWRNRLNAWSSTQPPQPQALSSAQEDQIKTEVRQTLTDYFNAFTSGDMEKTYAFWGDFDDFIHAGDGRVFGDRDKWLAWIDGNRPDEYISWNHSDIHVAVLAADAASYTMNFEVVSKTGGEEATVTGSWTYVLRKTNDGWRAVHSNGKHNEFSYYD